MIRGNYKRKVFSDAGKVANLTYQIGELDLLRKKSKEVKISEISSPEIQKVIFKLKQTLIKYRKLTGKGRGIAAVQIGIPLKIAVIFVDEKPHTIINPKITKKSEQLLLFPEVCMSANPIIARVIRPSWVNVSYFDESGKKQTWDYGDQKRSELVLNRVLQHEIDHMEGIINIDLVDSRSLILDSDPQFFKNAKFEKVVAPE